MTVFIENNGLTQPYSDLVVKCVLDASKETIAFGDVDLLMFSRMS